MGEPSAERAYTSPIPVESPSSLQPGSEVFVGPGSHGTHESREIFVSRLTKADMLPALAARRGAAAFERAAGSDDPPAVVLFEPGRRRRPPA